MNAASTYREAWDRLPASLRGEREAFWERFASNGFPSKKLEDWRYTDLSVLADAQFADTDATQDLAIAPGLAGWDSLVFIDGHRRDATSHTPRPALADDGITALNAALVRDGLDLHVARNQQAKPLHIQTWNTGNAMSHLRHRIVLEAGAEATLLVDMRGQGAATLSTAVLEASVGPNAVLRLLRIQDLNEHASDLTRTEIVLSRDARLEYVGLDLGGGLVRHDLNVHLIETGAAAEVHGVFAPSGATHVDTHTRIRHAAPHTTSRESFRGLVGGRAHAVFNGKIVVEKGAQKTDSEQQLASLLLSPGAQISAKPEFEIYADDVKCAHGATCGQLDEMALYYLRSRGLDADTARNLLLLTFAHHVLARVSTIDVRREMESRLIGRLPGAGVSAEALA